MTQQQRGVMQRELDTDEEFFDVEEVLGDGDLHEERIHTRDTQQQQQQQQQKRAPQRLTPEKMVDQDRLEKCGRWLSSIPRDDILALRQTSEYNDFLRAFERLGQAHRRVVAMNRSFMEVDGGNNQSDKKSMMANFSFLQHLAVDDVVLRVFEYLECHSLIRTSSTCSRFRELANLSARQRTHDVARTRQLNHVMQLLRAKEQIDGVGNNGPRDCHVSVPLLGMRQRILVTDAGDDEYNGVYFCTGSNGNGFVFTKARNSMLRASSRASSFLSTPPLPTQDDENGDVDEQMRQQQVPAPDLRDQDRILNWDEAVEPGKLLRCIIAKRFSNETILWYMSKEVEAPSTDDTMPNVSVPEITQVFSYWAKLMVVGEAPADMCCCPSLTSVLSRNGDPAWQPLSSTRLTHPPTVELLTD